MPIPNPVRDSWSKCWQRPCVRTRNDGLGWRFACRVRPSLHFNHTQTKSSVSALERSKLVASKLREKSGTKRTGIEIWTILSTLLILLHLTLSYLTGRGHDN